MATIFAEPGGDADFLVATTTGFWSSTTGTPAVATDFVHGNHIKSIKPAVGSQSFMTKGGVLTDAGTRISFYLYLNALPSLTAFLFNLNQSGGAVVTSLNLTTGGVLQLEGISGATLVTGKWYRISLAYTITSTTVNRFELFVDGVSSVSITNATLANGITTTDTIQIGNCRSNAGNTVDIRLSDHYIDNSNSLKDTGNIWVTAKRPFANGTTNGFTTQIGSGGSGYGSGHSPQVNERPLSNTNGWSIIGAGSAVTEEYNIENKSTGDIDISQAVIIDYIGWVDAKSIISETGSIIVNGVSTNISLTNTETLFTKVAGSTTYPAGTGTDIGIICSTTVTTVSLFETGVLVIFIPNSNFLMFMP